MNPILTRNRKILIAGLVAWIALALFAVLYLTGLQASHSLDLLASSKALAGETLALRVQAQSLKYNDAANLSDIHATLIDQSGVPTQSTTLTGNAIYQATLEVPREPGTYSLRVEGTLDDGDVIVAVAPLEVVASNALPELNVTPEKSKRYVEREGSLVVDVAPTDGVLPMGLTGSLTISLKDSAGNPVSQRVQPAFKRGRSTIPLPELLETDSNGFAHMQLNLVEPVFDLDVKTAEDEPSRGVHTIYPVATQFTLHTTSSLWAPGAKFKGILQSLNRTGPIFIDIWAGDFWISTAQTELRDGHASIEIALPQNLPTPQLLWIQAYQSSRLPDTARAGRYLFLGSSNDLDSFKLPNDSQALRATLGQIPQKLRNPPLLYDSSESAKASIDTIRHQGLVIAIWVLSLGALALCVLLIVLVIQNERRVQEAWFESGADEPIKQRHIASYIATVIGLLLLFIFSILAILLHVGHT